MQDLLIGWHLFGGSSHLSMVIGARLWTILLLLDLIGLTACGQSANPGLERGETAATAEAIGSEVPREFEFTRLPGAAVLLERVVKVPGDIRAREDLADLYRRAGYQSFAAFFAATVAMLEERPLRYADAYNATKWLCADTDDQLSGRSAASKTAMERSAAGEFGEAAEILNAAMERDGVSCFLAVQWSEAALYDAVPPAAEVDWPQLELALRVFVTGVEEVHTGPAASAGSAASFETLSAVLGEMGDYAACYTAAMIATERLTKDDHLPTSVRDGMRDRLQVLKDGCQARLDSLSRAPSS